MVFGEFVRYFDEIVGFINEIGIIKDIYGKHLPYTYHMKALLDIDGARELSILPPLGGKYFKVTTTFEASSLLLPV
ncbi:MAG: hypothetical protein QXW76_05615 [Candidatus Korarchaeum sp.]